MAAKFDGVTLLIVGCAAVVVCCVLMVAWRVPDASDVRNLGMPGSTSPGSTAAGWAAPGSTAIDGTGRTVHSDDGLDRLQEDTI